MSDIWGWDAIPQDYGHYESFTFNGVERKGDFYGLLFCTEDAANAVSHAVRNHDRLEQENAELRENTKRLLQELCDIQGQCIAEIAMGYKLDAESIGCSIYQATGMTNPELITHLALLNKQEESK